MIDDWIGVFNSSNCQGTFVVVGQSVVLVVDVAFVVFVFDVVANGIAMHNNHRGCHGALSILDHLDDFVLCFCYMPNEYIACAHILHSNPDENK